MTDAPKVTVTKAVFDFLVRECERVHGLMDIGGIPRTAPGGGQLTMAQRVDVYVRAHAQFLKDLEEARGEDDQKGRRTH
jgi:hypothetical protein